MSTRQKLTYTFYVGGVQVDKLTTEHKQKIGERLSEAMSLYYTQHPLEHQKLNFKENKK